MILELQQVAKIFPQAESYYIQNNNKDQVIEGQQTVIDTLFKAFKKSDERANLYEEQLKLKDDEIDIIKPKWWQEPVIIIGEIIIAFITGIMIAK